MNTKIVIRKNFQHSVHYLNGLLKATIPQDRLKTTNTYITTILLTQHVYSIYNLYNYLS